MDPQIKEKWLEALRSGQYQQCTSVLHRPGVGHCCLGVLCDLALKDGVIKDIDKDEDGDIIYDNHVIHLPPSVKEWAGLDSYEGALINPITIDNYHYHDLVSLNDDIRYSFYQIADVIEEQF